MPIDLSTDLPADHRRTDHRRTEECGTALLLVPSLLLILLMATALVVDASYVFTAKRDLAEAAAAAANDASSAVDDEAFYRTGELRIDQPLAQRLANDVMAVREHSLVPEAALDVTATVLDDGEPGVAIVATAEVHLLFARFLPDRASRVVIHSSARAAARRRMP